jgi:putative oxidoreductase
MLAKFDNQLLLVGRLLLASLFLPAGIGKIMNFAGTAGYIGSVGLPLAEIGVAIAILVEVGGGAALLVGFQTRLVSLVLALFTLAASIIFHAYWAIPDAKVAYMQQLMFNKNIAVVGGLLVLAVAGAGAFSVDGKRKS